MSSESDSEPIIRKKAVNISYVTNCIIESESSSSEDDLKQRTQELQQWQKNQLRSKDVPLADTEEDINLPCDSDFSEDENFVDEAVRQWMEREKARLLKDEQLNSDIQAPAISSIDSNELVNIFKLNLKGSSERSLGSKYGRDFSTQNSKKNATNTEYIENKLVMGEGLTYGFNAKTIQEIPKEEFNICEKNINDYSNAQYYSKSSFDEKSNTNYNSSDSLQARDSSKSPVIETELRRYPLKKKTSRKRMRNRWSSR